MNPTFSKWKSLRRHAKVGLFLSASLLWYTISENKEDVYSKKWYYRQNLNEKIRKISNNFFPGYNFNWYALSEEQRKILMKKQTDVYLWGNGYQVDMSLDYANFYPKKIKNFSGQDDPQIIIVKFGEFHEAYLDKNGKIHICQKHSLPSMKIQGTDDCQRSNMKMLEIKGRKITDMTFTHNRLFAITNKNEVYVWKINYELPEGSEGEDIFDMDTRDFVITMEVEPIHITELKNIKEIASGTDHFIALDFEGNVWAMGDDTFGQCGQHTDFRPEIPPFKERRVGRPRKVLLPCKAASISAGFRHNFAINEAGEVYGWGYNNQQQLSHSEEFAHEVSQKHVLFEPMKITREFEGKRVIKAEGGKDFSVFVTKDRRDITEVWSTGNNLRGQLGINRISHLQDITRVDDISGFVDNTRQVPLQITNLAWGRRHSMLTFNYGAFFIWGDNEKGQLGNRKRKFGESPYPCGKFEEKHNVLNVEANYDNCAVIVERLPEKIRDKDDEDERLRKKRSKRQAKQVQNLPKQIVIESPPPSLIQRIREKISKLLKNRQLEVEKMNAIKKRAKLEKEENEKKD